MNPKHPILLRSALALVVSLLMGGCATSSRFAVASECQDSSNTPARSFRLVAGPSLAPAARTVLGDVRTALSGRGLFEAAGGVRADLEITVDIEHGPATPRVITTREPVYLVPSLTGLPGRQQSPSSAILTPRAVTHREATRTVVVFPRVLQVTARYVEAPAGAPPAWEVAVLHEGDAAEMRAHGSRWMIAAAMDWIGRSSQGPAVVELHRGDRRVAFLERGVDPKARGLAAQGLPGRQPQQAGS